MWRAASLAVPHTSHQEALLSCSGRERGVGSLGRVGGESEREGEMDFSKSGVIPAKALSGYKDPRVMQTTNALRSKEGSVNSGR